MSKVKHVIEHLEQMPHDEKICITTWTREAVEELLDEHITDDQWHYCIKIWDMDDQAEQWMEMLRYAREKAGAK